MSSALKFPIVLALHEVSFKVELVIVPSAPPAPGIHHPEEHQRRALTRGPSFENRRIDQTLTRS
jgi:hypothetical protein